MLVMWMWMTCGRHGQRANTNTLSQVREALPSSSVSQVPYTTARLSLSEFTYKVSPSTGQMFIRFYFHPVSYGLGFDQSKALFSVQAGGFTLLHDFNASVTADALGAETLRREFCLNIDEGQSLTITFTPSRAIPDAYAFINGIEIVSMPTNLYYTASESHGVDYVGNEVNYLIENSTAMEMVYRINIGGSSLSFDQDTGMYRNWDSYVEEYQYLDDQSLRLSVLPQNSSIQLNFSTVPKYSAPSEVYQTGRSMGLNRTINKSYNLTWEFPVDSMFYYLVRLHFCEFEPDITEIRDRDFLIYIANQTAEKNADVISWSGGNGRPVYRDYVVFMPADPESQKKVNLFLTLQANPNDWITTYNDAILNGLEIFKLNHTNGNLAGPNPDPPPYIPFDAITVQCGYSGQLVNPDDGRNWTGDISSKFSPFEMHQAASYTSLVRDAPPLSSFASRAVPYNRSRLSRSEFTYTFNLTTGQKFIRLYFYPVSYGVDFLRSNAVFSVKAGGFTLLHNFNTSLTADASGMETIYREFCVSIEEGEKILNITFTPRQASPDAHAFINGIEIVSMPRNLYYTPTYRDGVAFVGNQINFRIENTTVLEMVYRLNVGGVLLLPKKDTGMYRKWDSYDEEKRYLDTASLSLSRVLQQNTSIELNFNTIAKYTAPKEVYQTGRSMGEDANINKSFNLIWQFPVDSEFSYLVRLHFCEFQPKITKVRERIFKIQMVNLTAEQGADIIEWSGGNESPVYKDYLVSMPTDPGGTRKKVNLSLALQANPNAGILNGLEIFKLSDLNGNFAGPTDLTPSSSVKHNTKSNRILAIAAGVASGLLVLSVMFGFLIFRRRLKAKSFVSIHGPTKSTETRGSSLPPYLCRYFPLAEIKAATQNFNDSFIIGVGGFGNVYKGYIDDGGATPVAIKRLKPESSQGAHEFKTEIELLSQLRHRHLVSLIGYCTDDNEMILVYDYMARGTLADHLYHKDNPPLSWEQRLQICIGAARGLSYLHTGAKGTIIHRDVKSTNILLDEKWVAKVSDFGLSKMGTTNTSKTHISTMVKGSFGYLDPEYYRRQRLTEKSDVFSFGVVLCEVLCARPAVMHTVELRQMNLAEWVRSCHRDGELDQIIDPSIRGKIEIQCLNQFVEIAMSCMNDSGIERPSMNDVVRALELALQLHRNCIERNNEVAFVNDSADAELRSSKPGCATDESIQCISETIFSEINDPNGR
ncbi:hypothetical protein L3X38_019953 [Prunus dulcis]|uniref:Protein kinase domain-containing protein n=1 Tax=Prunus dulcis TaxID=3755 RepID=A0AAD4WC47_PRUDU|nr:hypothetical protein L3X38_019953 [Prunus dulcis]